MACNCSLIFVLVIQMTVLLQSNREVTSNLCLLVGFIRLAINLDAMSLSNIFSSLIFMFRCKGITVLIQ